MGEEDDGVDAVAVLTGRAHPSARGCVRGLLKRYRAVAGPLRGMRAGEGNWAGSVDSALWPFTLFFYKTFPFSIFRNTITFEIIVQIDSNQFE